MLQFEHTLARFNQQSADGAVSQQLNFLANQNEAWRRGVNDADS